MEGFIKIFRNSLESAVFQNANLWQVWCYCLMRANHKETKILFNKREEILKEGCFIIGRESGSKDCNMKPTTFYLQLKTLEKLDCIKIEPKNKFSIISIINWKKYQIDNNKNIDYNLINSGVNKGDSNFDDNRMTTNRQQNDTDKNVKNDKNDKKYNAVKNSFSIEHLPSDLNGDLFYKNNFFFITIELKNKLLQKFKDKNFSEKDLEIEFDKMEAWLENGKKVKNYKLFFINWLSKCKGNDRSVYSLKDLDDPKYKDEPGWM